MRSVRPHTVPPIRLVIPIATWAAALILVILRFRFGVEFSFAYAPLNYVSAIAVVCAIPVSLVMLRPFCRPPPLRWLATLIGVVAALPAFFISFMMALGCLSAVSVGSDPAFEKIGELRAPTCIYRLYRTDEGALLNFGLVLRREWTVLPGLRLTHTIKSYYPAMHATLRILSAGVGVLSVEAYGPDQPSSSYEFTL
jgi:hypothetical protein